MKKVITILLIILVLAAGVGFGVYHHKSNETKFNDDYINGNTAGNLYNAGIFCTAADGTIYFANPSDSSKLYSMNSDGSDLTKISDDVATFINADDNYIYYVRNNPVFTEPFSFLTINTDSLCRLDRSKHKKSILLDSSASLYASLVGNKIYYLHYDDKDFTTFYEVGIDGADSLCRLDRSKHKKSILLDSSASLYASLVGNKIYYLHYDDKDFTTFYEVGIDGADSHQVDKTPYRPCSVVGQYIYFNGVSNDHNIWRFDTVTDTSELVLKGNYYMPAVIGDTIFFLDNENNYTLASTDLSGSSAITTLSDDRIDCYNITGNYIYFQRNSTSTPALCRMKTDGSDYTVIAEGNYTNINATETDVYFRDFASGVMYKTPIADPSDVEIFNPGTGSSDK